MFFLTHRPQSPTLWPTSDAPEICEMNFTYFFVDTMYSSVVVIRLALYKKRIINVIVDVYMS